MSLLFRFANLSRLIRFLLANAVEADSKLATECSAILDSIIRTHSSTELSILENEMSMLLHDWNKQFGEATGFYAFAELVQLQFVSGICLDRYIEAFDPPVQLRTPSDKLRDLCSLVLQHAYHN